MSDIAVVATIKAASGHMVGWSPEQIAAFYYGVGKVLGAVQSAPKATRKDDVS